MSSRFDVCLLLYVIRLAGWLKHCNLSLSLSLSLSAVFFLNQSVCIPNLSSVNVPERFSEQYKG